MTSDVIQGDVTLGKTKFKPWMMPFQFSDVGRNPCANDTTNESTLRQLLLEPWMMPLQFSDLGRIACAKDTMNRAGNVYYPRRVASRRAIICRKC